MKFPITDKVIEILLFSHSLMLSPILIGVSEVAQWHMHYSYSVILVLFPTFKVCSWELSYLYFQDFFRRMSLK